MRTMNNKMNNKVLIIMLAFVLAFAMGSCKEDKPAQGDGGDSPPPEDAAKGPAEDPGAGGQQGAFSFSPGGVRIVLGEDAAPVLEKLGEPNDVFEVESCAFVGTDRIYYYPGFNISTYPADEGEDRVLAITFSADTVETDQGVYLGMKKADVLAIYGEGEEAGDAVSYYNGGEELRIFFERDTAVNIAFYFTEAIKVYEEE